MNQKTLDISIIIPVYNEEKNIVALFNNIKSEIENITSNYEIIWINDGSTDSTSDELKKISDREQRVSYISFRKNFGKAHALNKGFGVAEGDLVFTMDGDHQDDPKEFFHFINKINQGYDVVSGWKYKRRDPFTKRIMSKIFNSLTRGISGVKIHDFNCGFKLYKKEVVKSINLYGDLHRYIPVLAHLEGFKVGEIKVTHHERKFGKSKYGISRLFKGFLDLLTIKFLLDFSKRPMHLFGFLGIILLGLGILLGIILAYYNLFFGVPMVRPALFLAIIMVVVGIQFFSLGFIGEMIIFLNEQKKETDTTEMNNHGNESN